jgi:thiol:disulfide interchange protein
MNIRSYRLYLTIISIILALGRSYRLNNRLYVRQNRFLANSQLNVVTEVASTAAFDDMIKSAGNDKKLVVIDYSTTWCGESIHDYL